MEAIFTSMNPDDILPEELKRLPRSQDTIPFIAKSERFMKSLEEAIQHIITEHHLYRADSRSFDVLEPDSIHLVLTSPPYWTLKKYVDGDGQLGHIDDYEDFLSELDIVWQKCFNALVPGGRLICVVGDVCLSRKKNNGEHSVIPLHASIQEHCRSIGYNNVSPIIWHKIANAKYEVTGNTRFLGKPYEPNGVIKNDIEYILMQRKPGGYRKPSYTNRLLSIISDANHKEWFQQIWNGPGGTSTRDHPAPYPFELAERLIRMYSFVGDVVFDPFMGTGTTNHAAAVWGRNSIGVELIPKYFTMASLRMESVRKNLYREIVVRKHG